MSGPKKKSELGKSAKPAKASASQPVDSADEASAPKLGEESELQPFPGLRYYDEAREILFAGRDDEIERFGQALRRADVMILHGRTGCGKSSFLRAGVKPHLARVGSPISFAGAKDAFTVIRSTWDPLGAFVRRLLYIADLFADRPVAVEGAPTHKSAFGELRPGFNAQRIGEMFPIDPVFREELINNAEEAAKALGALARAMRTAPIIVIDQAEEVFTQKPDQNELKTETGEPIVPGIRRSEYFRFIHIVATTNTRTRIVVSLRTEYKGLFDDEVAAHDDLIAENQPTKKLIGFHLSELDEDGLVEAIRRPSLRDSDPEWKRLKAALSLPDDTRAPGQASNALRIPEEVARQIARDLRSDKVPSGGILPALQATCIRLWEQSRNARSRRGGEIKMPDLTRLGAIDNQVEEYLQEKVRAACEAAGWKTDVLSIASSLMRALKEKIVLVEADGRAVTLRPRRTEFEAHVENLGGSEVINQLCNFGILKTEGEYIALNHDSLALALNKWFLAQPSQSGMMMMRMGMVTTRSLADLDQGQLFLDEDPPHLTQVLAIEDFNWDRSLPHFAQSRGFAQRLGISLEERPSLNAAKRPNGVSEESWNWPALLGKAVEIESAWEKKKKDKITKRRRRWNNDNQRVMVAADFKSFLGAAVEELDPKSFASRWCDLMVSDLFVGNALIGPDDTYAREIADAFRVDSAAVAGKKTSGVADAARSHDELIEKLKAIIGRALEAVIAKNTAVRASNRSGYDLLMVAARLCVRPDLMAGIKKLEATGRLKTLEDMHYRRDDPLVDFLVEDNSAETRFVVGQAGTRAWARQSRFYTYFGAKELVTLAAHEMKRRQRVDYENNRQLEKATRDFELNATNLARVTKKAQIERRKGAADALASEADQPIASWEQTLDALSLAREAKNAEDKRRELMVRDIAEEMQKIITHTVWNVSLPAAGWKQGLNRAFALRLASVGYFTSEFVRTNMDDFINFIADRVQKTAVDGQRLGRTWIKESIADCYLFLRFDEFGPAVFDLDSLQAYWSEHGALSTRSVAGEIYQELATLREATLAHYQVCAESISWLRYDGAYRPSDDKVRLAFRLKELAWNNFNIFNFYDAERYMGRAATLLRERVEEEFKMEREAEEG